MSLQRVVVRLAVEAVEADGRSAAAGVGPAVSVVCPELGEVGRFGRHRVAVDRVRQVDAVEGAGIERTEGHDVAVAAADQVAAAGADIADLRHLVPRDALRKPALKLCVFGNLNESGVSVLIARLPMRLASVASRTVS